jgi:hypothetical protein
VADLEYSAVVTLLGQGVSVDALIGCLARLHGLPEAKRRMRGHLDQLAARTGDPADNLSRVSSPSEP